MTNEPQAWIGIKTLNWARKQCVGNPVGKNVLLCVATFANDKGACNPSQETIAKVTEYSVRAVREWLNNLIDLGFLTRIKPKKSKGPPLTDTLILNMGLKPKYSSMELQGSLPIHKTLAPANDARHTGTSRQTYRQDMPPNKDILINIEKPSSGARARGVGGFEKLWTEWPAKDRPDKIKAAKWSFGRLTAEEQAFAVRHAKCFRRLAKAKKEMPLMIPYLKNREFISLKDGPSIDPNGRFAITPDRPEWDAWRKYFQAKYGDGAVRRFDERNSFVVNTRWPPDKNTSIGGQAG